MNLWYISIGLNPDLFDTGYCYSFTKRTRYISNFLSKEIRKLRFKTDGTYRMISVDLENEPVSDTEIVFGDVLRVSLPFDQDRYETVRNSADCEFFLELFETGFRKASQFKEIPLQPLLDLVERFRAGGCKNQWLHKTRRFKQIDLEVSLHCDFTPFVFKLTATITRISTKQVLCSGEVLRTDPDELAFDYKFKDVVLDDKNNIMITDHIDRPSIFINTEKALRGELFSTGR